MAASFEPSASGDRQALGRAAIRFGAFRPLTVTLVSLGRAGLKRRFQLIREGPLVWFELVKQAPVKVMKFADIFKDAEGRVVIGQKPNWPIYVAIGLFALRFFPVSGLQPVSIWGVRVVMAYWAYLEIVSGVNTFRRILGLLVGLYLIYVTVRDLL